MPVVSFSFGPKTAFERGETAPISLRNYFKEEHLLKTVIWRRDPFETARNLNYITLSLAKTISNNHKLTLSDEPFATFRNVLVTCGRIFCNSSSGLDKNSIFLEGTVEVDAGNTVQLDVGELPEFAFFPGQIVVIKGKVRDGSFVVESYWDRALLPLPKPVIFVKPRQIVAASGPFNFESLETLRSYIHRWRPHVVILFGPLVAADSKETYDTHFQGLMNQIEELTREDNEVTVVASCDEIVHSRIFPSPPYLSENGKKVRQVSDPTCLDLNGFVIGLSGVDVLSHLKKTEFCKNGNGDVERRLVSYLLGQQSFYPLYPANEGARVDYPLVVKYGMMGCRPNLMVLPSDLPVFAKEIDECFVVNPGRDGTFARIEVTSNNTVSCEVLRL